ncbi:MAG: hypothetical protein LAP87_24870 [Acidobacteriia bacterium]|nr:hypothetical protein [Terriglobia bacterium]
MMELHATVTAETGTVGQAANVVEPDRTVRFHELPAVPLFVHLTWTAALPGTTGAVAGLVAVNEMVPGVAVTVNVAANGWMSAALGVTFPGAGGPAAAAAKNAIDSQDASIFIGRRW